MTKRFIILFVFIFIFTGCVAPPTEVPTDISAEDPEVLFQTGQYELAANKFIALSQDISGGQQTFYRLRGTAALARAGKIIEAKQVLAQTTTESLDSFSNTIYTLALAHIAIAERKPTDVPQMLSDSISPSVPDLYAAEYYGLRAEANSMLGNKLETAGDLVKRENYLSDAKQILTNQQNIWTALAGMSERSLQQLRSAPPPDVMSGWMELVQIAKVHQLSPARLKEQIVIWQEKYPGHPVSGEILTALTQRQQEDVAYPDHLALMLPLTGKFARAGEALRDGFLAAYFTRQPDDRQSIRIYDIGNTKDVSAVYEQAVTEGAEFIVGPLTKAAVSHIGEMDELPVPILALNYMLEDDSARSNFYQFGLSPEEEARQVAERTWLDGHVNAAVLIPIGPWGERIYQAFKERWELMGGKIVERQTYEPTKTDFSIPIRMLLNIDDSQRRYQRVSTILKRDLKFTTRRRQDIDFVFLAAYPRQARQIRPQLKFYHASNVPVYATSHVYTGILNPERDRDMDGLLFGDMPWVLSESTAHRGIRSEIENQISDAGNALQRLYALGIDAFNIIGALNTLRNYPYERFDGETGSLSLDSKLRIRRQLTWVKFRSGRPVTLNQGNL
jgi:outer membrane PBP1 activator LpoA protein